MGAFLPPALERLWRYYQAAIVNTAFGYATYALLVSTGLNIFIAQLIAQVLAVTFNYFSYSRHVFRDSSASKPRFIAAYAVNYFVSLASLAMASTIFTSPYVAGLVALLFASLVNFVILRRFVFIGGPRVPSPLPASGADR